MPHSRNVLNPFPNTDYFLSIAQGIVPGHETVIVRGHNPDIDSAGGFVDVAESGNLSYLAAAETMNIVSSSTDDDGDPLGIGLRTLSIQGVDNTGVKISEIITLNGTTNVLTTKSYLRVNFMVGLKAGSTGWNVGDVTATASSAATVQASMGATESITNGSHYTVPLGHTLHVERLEFNIAKNAGGQAPVTAWKVLARPGGAGNAWIQFFAKRMDADVTDELDLELPFPTAFNQASERTDLRTRLDTNQNDTECRVRMYGVLVDDRFK